jgi:hypothetical protein
VVELLRRAVPASVLVVAVDPGKVSNRVWLTSGERGLIGEPVSLPVLREGIDTLTGLIGASGVTGPPVIGVEATGGLHRAWVAELERRFPGSVRLVAPSETQAARAQLGWRRYKTDDRDCAALVWLLRRRWPAGRSPTAPWMPCSGRSVTGVGWSPTARSSSNVSMTSSRCSARACQRRSATDDAVALEDPTGQAVLVCAAAFAGRAPTTRSLQARAPGRLTQTTARFWVERWRRLLPLRLTPSSAPSGWVVTLPATSDCSATSPR